MKRKMLSTELSKFVKTKPMLSMGITKQQKGRGYLAAGLIFAPHTISGYQVCPASSVGCRASCNMWFSGRKVTKICRDRAIWNTRQFFENREAFMERLHKDIVNHQRRAFKVGLLPAVRLNTSSDLEWYDVIKAHPKVLFYDYTKVRSRFSLYLSGDLPSNYYLTFSRWEGCPQATMARYLRAGGNVAYIYDVDYYPQVRPVGKLPRRQRVWGKDWPVVDGDTHDWRFPWVDGEGKVIGLRLKGTNAAKQRGRDNGLAV